MNERDLKAVARILDERGHIYQTNQGYWAIHVYSKDVGLIDRLARRFGHVHEMRGGVHDWCWARQAEMHERLPRMLKWMSPEGQRRFGLLRDRLVREPNPQDHVDDTDSGREVGKPRGGDKRPA